MLAPTLHATGWHSPDPCAEVDFVPGSADHLARSGRRQDRKTQSERRHASLVTQPSHEGWDLRVGQRSVVLHLSDLGTGRQQLIQMPPPAGRIVLFEIPPGLRPTQHRLNPSTQPRRGLGLRLPNRFNGLHDEAGVDRRYRQRAKHWPRIGIEARRPLGSVFGVPPRQPSPHCWPRYANGSRLTRWLHGRLSTNNPPGPHSGACPTAGSPDQRTKRRGKCCDFFGTKVIGVRISRPCADGRVCARPKFAGGRQSAIA